MKSLNNKIIKNFNNASKSYDKVAIVQQAVAKDLINQLFGIENFNPKTILDLGTGTGSIVELLLKKYSKSQYSLNDISTKMLDFCRVKFKKQSNFNYIQADLSKLKVNNFDLIISNFAFQWLKDLSDPIKYFYAKSSKVFAFSTLLQGTFEEWENIVNKYQKITIPNYPTAKNLVDLCNNTKDNNDFKYSLIDYSLYFRNALEFLYYLKSLGALASPNNIYVSNLKKLIINENLGFNITYKIFTGIFIKL